MDYKTITLSVEDWQEIENAVMHSEDCGPTGEGWQSRELAIASAALTQSLIEATHETR